MPSTSAHVLKYMLEALPPELQDLALADSRPRNCMKSQVSLPMSTEVAYQPLSLATNRVAPTRSCQYRAPWRSLEDREARLCHESASCFAEAAEGALSVLIEAIDGLRVSKNGAVVAASHDVCGE